MHQLKALSKLLLGFACVVAVSTGHTLAGPNDAMLQQAHAWARFGKGAWKEVRIFTQNFDEQGNLTDTSVTNNKTTVIDVTSTRVTLQIEVTVEVAGKQFPSQPQIIMQGYAGETLGETQATKSLDPETVHIDGKPVRCENQQLEITGGVTREVNVITYSPGHQPAILRRKSTLSEASGNKPLQEVVSEVKAVQMARRILDHREPQEAYLVRSEQKNDRGSTITWSWHMPDVPGEVVDECSLKKDLDGTLVRRTTLELIAYGLPSPDDLEAASENNQRSEESLPRRTRRQQRRAK